MNAMQAATRFTSSRWARAALLVAGLLLSGVTSGQQATRIGYVDLKRLLDNAPQMSSGSQRLRDEFAERDRQLKADESRLADLQVRRDAGSTGATQSVQALDNEIEALERKIRRTRETLREELRRRSEEETERSWRAINEAVAAYAREQAYDLIVSSPVFYASPSIDITDQVLARLRAQASPANGDGG